MLLTKTTNNQVVKEHKNTNLKLEFIDSKEDIFMIEADKGRINQVISNLRTKCHQIY